MIFSSLERECAICRNFEFLLSSRLSHAHICCDLATLVPRNGLYLTPRVDRSTIGCLVARLCVSRFRSPSSDSGCVTRISMLTPGYTGDDFFEMGCAADLAKLNPRLRNSVPTSLHCFIFGILFHSFFSAPPTSWNALARIECTRLWCILCTHMWNQGLD